ncbi:MAG: SMP-30/gluconolactonase/LRE family protein [Burkholderiales bacterium]|jgi:sugar lactone lactonase YvrE|nr:SMP-30/gluconolactonase/LRE family protein [Nitrosomonadaceae bacterium]
MSSSLEVGLVLDAQAQLGECPLWHPDEQVLYWVDIAGKHVHRFNPDSRETRTWDMPTEPGCIGLAQPGLVVACRDGFYRLDTEDGKLRKLAPAPYDPASMRFNDGKVDVQGRFWAGAMFEPRTAERAAMYVLERGQVREAWGPQQNCGVKVSNGLAFDEASAVVYQADTPNHVVYRFRWHAGIADPSSRQVFITRQANREAADYAGRPDGATIDAAGNYWSAQYEGGQVVCYSPQGELVETIKFPVRRTTMVAFGGSDYKTLYVTSAREGASATELGATPLAGGLFAVSISARHTGGRPEPFYVD